MRTASPHIVSTALLNAIGIHDKTLSKAVLTMVPNQWPTLELTRYVMENDFNTTLNFAWTEQTITLRPRLVEQTADRPAFDIDKACSRAMKRVNKAINESAQQHSQAITRSFQMLHHVRFIELVIHSKGQA